MKDKYKDEIKLFIIDGSAFLGAYLLKRLAETLLKDSTEESPLRQDEEEPVKWLEAIAWAAATGAMASVLKLFIKQGSRHQLDRMF